MTQGGIAYKVMMEQAPTSVDAWAEAVQEGGPRPPRASPIRISIRPLMAPGSTTSCQKRRNGPRRDECVYLGPLQRHLGSSHGDRDI